MDFTDLIPNAENMLNQYSAGLLKIPSGTIDEQYVHKRKASNVLITEINEHNIEYDTIKHEDVKFYTCIGMPNLNCQFIFDHPQDHYPLMLLIEMGRQMAISISHLYKDVPLEDCKNTVDWMDFKIYDFVELDLPLVIGCIDKIVKNKSSIQIRELYYLFYQNGKKCSESRSAVSVMTTRLYNRYRLSSRKSTAGTGDMNTIFTNEMLSNNSHDIARQHA